MGFPLTNSSSRGYTGANSDVCSQTHTATANPPLHCHIQITSILNILTHVDSDFHPATTFCCHFSISNHFRLIWIKLLNIPNPFFLDNNFSFEAISIPELSCGSRWRHSGTTEPSSTVHKLHSTADKCVVITHIQARGGLLSTCSFWQTCHFWWGPLSN